MAYSEEYETTGQAGKDMMDNGPVIALLSSLNAEVGALDKKFSDLTERITPVLGPGEMKMGVNKADAGRPVQVAPDARGCELRARLFDLKQSVTHLSERMSDVFSRCEL